MTPTIDAAYYADLERRVRTILGSVEPSLMPDRMAILVELVEHNEPGIAVEMLSDMFASEKIALTPCVFAQVEEVAQIMGLDPVVYERLRGSIRRD